MAGCCNPKGTSTSRRRNGGTRSSRSATSSLIRQKSTSPPDFPGSKISAPRMWRCEVGDSREANPPSRPDSRSIGPTGPSTRSRRAPAARSRELVHRDEADRFDPLDDQLGDPVPPVDLVGRTGSVLTSRTHSSSRYPASMRPGVLRQVTPWRSANPLRGWTKPGPALGNGHGHTGGHQGAAAAGVEGHVGPGHQVGTGITRTGVAREGEVGIKADHRTGIVPGGCGPRPPGAVAVSTSLCDAGDTPGSSARLRRTLAHPPGRPPSEISATRRAVRTVGRPFTGGRAIR